MNIPKMDALTAKEFVKNQHSDDPWISTFVDWMNNEIYRFTLCGQSEWQNVHTDLAMEFGTICKPVLLAIAEEMSRRQFTMEFNVETQQILRLSW